MIIVHLWRMFNEGAGPFMVTCPLSVTDHWVNEVTRFVLFFPYSVLTVVISIRFSCGVLNPVLHYGEMNERRAELKKRGYKLNRNDVLLVPNHVSRLSLVHHVFIICSRSSHSIRKRSFISTK